MNEFNLADQEDIAETRIVDFITGVVSRSLDYAAAGVTGFGTKERLALEEHLLAFFSDPFLSERLKAFHAEEKAFMLAR